jgi:Plasmid pRiA4b ORF-3-like protein
MLTLKATLIHGPYAIDKWEAVFEIESDALLEGVHAFIQDTLDFDDDHLYEFFIARTENSRERLTFDDENGGLYDTSIESLYPLPERKHLYYLFDYGDHWLFKITNTAKTALESIRDVEYPRLIRESGTRPPQYPSEGEDAA